jgi:hypothetical protein
MIHYFIPASKNLFLHSLDPEPTLLMLDVSLN